uniref:PH domain-containing protein n=1 Tax=Agathobacter sp. TaxID=2021311 RepID=UPI004056BC20
MEWLLFFGLPWTFTKYTITQSFLTVEQGFLNTAEDNCYMYKIQDVKLNTSLMERIFGLATIICYTGDVTHPEIRHLEHFSILSCRNPLSFTIFMLFV